MGGGGGFLSLLDVAERQSEFGEKGAAFYDWPAPAAVKSGMAPDETMVRLVTSFATTPDDVDSFLSGL